MDELKGLKNLIDKLSQDEYESLLFFLLSKAKKEMVEENQLNKLLTGEIENNNK